MPYHAAWQCALMESMCRSLLKAVGNCHVCHSVADWISYSWFYVCNFYPSFNCTVTLQAVEEDAPVIKSQTHVTHSMLSLEGDSTLTAKYTITTSSHPLSLFCLTSKLVFPAWLKSTRSVAEIAPATMAVALKRLCPPSNSAFWFRKWKCITITNEHDLPLAGWENWWSSCDKTRQR